MATGEDPFAAMGGGVQNFKGYEGWKPRNMYSQEELDEYDRQQAGTTAPTAPPPSAYTPPPPTAAPPDQSGAVGTDPFAAIGGGVWYNNGWIPNDMYAQITGQQAPPPTGMTGPAPTAPPPPSNDPFAEIGGGVQLANGDWIPRDMATPEYLAAHGGVMAGTPPVPGGTAPGAPAPVPGTPGVPTDPRQPAAGTGAIGGAGEVTGPGSAILGQARESETQSATPGAAPTESTTNQGVQDTVRNSYLERAVQPLKIDPNDPNIRQQVDPFAAAQERGRRQYTSEAAERASAKGLGDSGALDAERRYAAERAGQATGMFESELVGREIQTRRDEIKDALVNLKGMLSDDQMRALQKEMAELDAAMKKLGIEAGVGTAGQELGLKRELGLGGLNLDLMRLLMNDRQFADTMGFNVADREAYYNNQSLQNMLR